MTTFDTIKKAFWGWLDRVATATIEATARVQSRRTVRLLETGEGRFAVLAADRNTASHPAGAGFALDDAGTAPPSSAIEEALRGGRLEVALRPERFIFKTIELPSRASEFLAGVVRAQIDRLTPWSPDQAAFGFGTPADVGSGRIAVTVAATAKAMLLPIITAFTERGARSVTLCVAAPETTPEARAIPILHDSAAGMLDVRRMRRLLLAVLAGAFFVAAGTSIAATIIDQGLQARQDELARRISARRAAALSARNASGDPKTLAERALARHKNESPSTVIALEILSKILPDSTYVTEMRIEGDKLRLSGVTHDAPQLIRLIEQTRHFKGASFFAPVTRSSSDTGDRFNIEARMEPNFSLTP